MASTADSRLPRLKLVLDEHYSPAIAEQLHLRGYDAVPVAERLDARVAQLRRSADEELLRRARDAGRAVVTEDVGDFMRLHHEFISRGELHAGIIFTSSRKFPCDNDAVGLLISALASFIDKHEAAAIAGDVAWL